MIKANIPLNSVSFFAKNYLIENNINNLIIACPSEELAKIYYEQILFFGVGKYKIIFFPKLDIEPYDSISPSSNIMFERVKILTYLSLNPSNNLLITNVENILAKVPPKDIFKNSYMRIKLKDQITIEYLSNFLVTNGFSKSSRAIDVGDFAVRGEILDLVLSKECGYRINFSWNVIESIKKFDLDTQISSILLNELFIGNSSEIILDRIRINNFKENYIKSFGLNNIYHPLYQAVTNGKKYPSYENFGQLFYNSLEFLIDYMPGSHLIYDDLCLSSLKSFEENYKEIYDFKVNNKTFQPIIHYNKIYTSFDQIIENTNNQIKIIDQDFDNLYKIDKLYDSNFNEQKTIYQKFIHLINEHKNKKIIICCFLQSQIERIKSILENYDTKFIQISQLSESKIELINLTKVNLPQGFYNNEYLFISYSDIFNEKLTISTRNATSNLKNILAELDNLQEGELIVHKQHGIGRFEALETLKIENIEHDFLKILYDNNDKLYIPVENIDLIKKYGSSDAILDKLGSEIWQRNKAKAKNYITSLALELISLSAKRKLLKADIIEYDSELYNQFVNNFTYQETEDQLKAIDDIKNDFSSNRWMDRLICGDVGFGKTEIAMRAIFMVAKSTNISNAQIALVVPTTILCKQHYSRFIKRFEKFNLHIVQLSGLLTSKEANQVRAQIKNGTANIIIGTQSLFSKNIIFHNLKFLVIDEEQHFGVSQKEHIKNLKTGIHVLSLSATPIPRTLQMSMVGIKDLSIVATPPLNRLEVRTNIMQFDATIIRDALLKEHWRGGRSFYVVPRIKDIDEIETILKKIVPELKYKIAHGSMKALEIDAIMNEFSNGGFDILIATNIIESGIDIESANSMIIHRPYMFSLSSLYQLRGRIGRSKFRAYAYLILPQNIKIMTDHAQKRLDIMANTCALGSGFTISSHDLDIRGFGNLLGEEQSGQIKHIGVELYQEILEQEINIISNQNEKLNNHISPIINLEVPIFIPNNYIKDSDLKIAIYRRIGNLENYVELDKFRDEMIDRFGTMPSSFKNLLEIVNIKHKAIRLNIENFDSSKSGFSIKFYDNSNGEKILEFVNKYSSNVKLRPNNRIIFFINLTEEIIIPEANKLLDLMIDNII